MHAYYKTRELGWTPVEKLKVMQPASKSFAWTPNGLWVYAPQVLHAIRTAGEVYVFPVATPIEPRRDDKRLRLLGGEARRKIVRLLGNEQNWWHGAYHILVGHHQPTDIGLIFRSRGSELVLFFLDDLVEGCFNGQNTGGELDFQNNKKKQLLEWKRRYANIELSAK